MKNDKGHGDLKFEKITVSTMPPGVPIESARGEGKDYSQYNYKNAEHQVDQMDRIKASVFEKAVSECWGTMRMMCIDRIPTAGQSECKQGGLCGFDGCSEIAEMRIRWVMANEG